MKSFAQFIAERAAGGEEPVQHRPIEFNKIPKIGWYREGDHIIGYHGTHDRNVDSVYRNGLNRSDPKTGMISVALDPHTAHGYAAMSSSGGEANFRAAGASVTTTPHHERSVFRLKIPVDWAEKHMDDKLSGNIGDARKRLADKAEYKAWREKNPHAYDHEYYMGSELRFKRAIPPEFIEGHMKKVPHPPEQQLKKAA